MAIHPNYLSPFNIANITILKRDKRAFRRYAYRWLIPRSRLRRVVSSRLPQYRRRSDTAAAQTLRLLLSSSESAPKGLFGLVDAWAITLRWGFVSFSAPVAQQRPEVGPKFAPPLITPPRPTTGTPGHLLALAEGGITQSPLQYVGAG